MLPRRTIIALCVAAIFSPLSAVLAQTTTQESSITPTAVATPIAVSSAQPTPTPAASTDGLEYYPTNEGESYDDYDPNALIDETDGGSAAGASGNSDTFINIPLGAQIAIISIVVIAGIVGLVFGWLWYQRRRRQWEIQGRRRSLVPRISVNERGGFRMSRPVYIRDSVAATPIVAVPPSAAQRNSGGSASVASFDPVDLEKGNVRSEFESDSKAAGWKGVFSKK